MKIQLGQPALDDERIASTMPFGRGLTGVAGSLILHAAVLVFSFVCRAPAAQDRVDAALPLPLNVRDDRLALAVAQPESAFVEPVPAPRNGPAPVTVAPVRAAPGGSRTIRSVRAESKPRGEMLREASTFGMAGRLGVEAIDVRSLSAESRIASNEQGGSRVADMVIAADAPLAEVASQVHEGVGVRGGPPGVALLGTCTRACRETAGRAVSGEIVSRSSSRARSWMRPRRSGSTHVRLESGDQVRGQLPPHLIQRIVRQTFGRFRLCYERSLRTRPGLEAHITATFIIGRDGGVTRVSAASKDAPPAMVACVESAFYGLSFPKPETGVVTVTYPLGFSTEPVDN